MNYTKGEWKVEDWGHCTSVMVTLDNGQRHTLVTDQYCYATKFNGNAKDNAQLTSAAPDMYEALKALIKRIDESGIFLTTQETFNAKTAIAKAEGKTI